MSTFANTLRVTDETFEEALGYVGMDLTYSSWNYEAGRDAIRHYAHGIGDDNPLWCDPDYARSTPFGDIVAPPTFLYTVSDTTCSPGLEGLQQIYAGTDWTFVRPVRRNEQLTYRAKVVGAKSIEGRTGGRMILQTGEVTFLDESGDEVGTAVASTWRIARGAENGGLTYEARPRHVATDAELEMIEAGVRAEVVAGADTRYWESVKVGDELTPLVKGPLDQITMTCFYAGQIGSPGYKASELRWKQWIAARENPASLPNYVDNTYYSELVLPSLGHQDDGVAQALGMPGAYDNGPQRISWLSHLATNWMSDRGWLTALSARVLRPNIFGDITWVRGTVVGKREDVSGESGLVDVDVVAINQLDQVTASATAIVRLPRRSA